ncbi:OmpH family outer membrane protein [uncultured Fretibacterium sp.]|uniref:OmpH family outer membrane protein n=1 Tax=uncultured Fretibacterium sp. TaxID=1678694 RepID=UPI00260F3CFD|nr:OmpH family outer membrane protein [uncultured Fretibacterium sp.]
MLFLRNFLVLSVTAIVFVLAAGGAANAAVDSVGVIDMYEVTNNHPKMNDAKAQLATISRQKETEAKAAADKESDPAKKAQIVQAKRMELAKEEQKIMDPIFRDCQQAVREVAVNKKLTLVLNKSVVLIGGSDITQDVIQQLAKGNAAPKKK